jgi:hypothetical protein
MVLTILSQEVEQEEDLPAPKEDLELIFYLLLLILDMKKVEVYQL